MRAAHDSSSVADGIIDNAESTHAHDHQHGGEHGHLPAAGSNVRVVGKAAINQDTEGRVADVGVHNGYAYLAAFSDPSCQKGGVYVFDTPKFTGDLLAFNNEICGDVAPDTVGGATLADVTNPKTHKYLSQGFGDFDPVGANGAGVAHEVHSVFVWDAGDKAYAVLVDDDEGADVDIFESPTRVPR